MKRSKYVVSVILLVSICMLSGCAALQKKFKRKKQQQQAKPFFYRPENYNIKPTLALYTKHYVMWKNFHRDMMENLGENGKKDKVNLDNMIGNLMDMKNMLVDEQGDKLQKEIDELQKLKPDIGDKHETNTKRAYIMRRLSNEFSVIKINFNYNKMAGHIREEWRFEKLEAVEAE